MVRLCLVVGLILSLGGSSIMAETVYPTGANVAASYQLSDTLIELGDTLTINRTVTNNESFDLSHLYFSENLPPACNLIDYAADIEGIPITPAFTDGQPDLVLPGCHTYWWVFDQPTGPKNTIKPGETVNLTIRITFDSVGTYALPFHAAAFNGGTTGYFVTADSEVVRTYVPTDVEDDERNLPSQFEFSRAYPNPFNGSAQIQYSGTGLAGRPARLVIRNILGQSVFQREFTIQDDHGSIAWEPSSGLSSGVYFYSLSVNSQSSGVSKGKLMLLK